LIAPSAAFVAVRWAVTTALVYRHTVLAQIETEAKAARRVIVGRYIVIAHIETVEWAAILVTEVPYMALDRIEAVQAQIEEGHIQAA
jgi:hypothetical protein